MDDLHALIATGCNPLIGHMRPYLRVVKEQQPVREKAYCHLSKRGGGRVAAQLDPERLCAVLDAGATLNINFLEELHPAVRRFADATARQVGCRVQVNLYYSTHPVPGFDPHFDTHDLSVLQLAGAKRWRMGRQIYPGRPARW